MSIRKTFRGLFGQSGGVGYHLAALTYAKKLWAPFRSQVSAELLRILRSGGEPDLSRVHLVVIGVSGGYCLERTFLSAFGRVSAVDMDPFAELIFKQRFGLPVRFIRQDFFRCLQHSDQSFEKWLLHFIPDLDRKSRSVFLFSNLLGQLGYLYSEEKLKEVGQGLTTAFKTGTSGWVSFHDRLSLPGKVRDRVIRSQERLSAEKLVEAFLLPGARGAVEVEEHALGEWVKEARGGFTYLSWRLNSERTQIIEICGST